MINSKNIDLQETQDTLDSDNQYNKQIELQETQETLDLESQDTFQIIDIKLHSIGRVYMNGFSSSYESTYPYELKNILPEKKFDEMINEINFIIQTYWSCDFCHYFGWVCALPTMGLSFCLPRICQSEAEEACLEVLEKYNKNLLYGRKLEIKLQKKCFKSYLQIRTLQDEYDENNQIRYKQVDTYE